MTEEEIKKENDKLKVKCDFCDRKFETKLAMHIHRASFIHQCVASDERYVIEDILNVFGKKNAR